MPSDPTKPIPASRLPKIRGRAVQLWQSPTIAERMFALTRINPVLLPWAEVRPLMAAAYERIDEKPPVQYGPTREVDPEVAQRFCTATSVALAAADLYWISPEYTRVAIASGSKLPDMWVGRDDIPAPSGLLAFAEPVTEIAFAGYTCPVTVFGWRMVPGGMWLNLYARTDQITGAARHRLRENNGPLMPLSPGAGLAFDQEIAFSDDHARRLWGAVLATFFLIRQPNLTEVTDTPAERDYTRSYARAHGGRTPDPVRVVDIRHHEPRQRTGTATPTGRKLTVRRIVGEAEGGFWRDQACGPGWSLRRRLWIMPFERGPKDAPLVTGGIELVRRLR